MGLRQAGRWARQWSGASLEWLCFQKYLPAAVNHPPDAQSSSCLPRFPAQCGTSARGKLHPPFNMRWHRFCAVKSPGCNRLSVTNMFGKYTVHITSYPPRIIEVVNHQIEASCRRIFHSHETIHGGAKLHRVSRTTATRPMPRSTTSVCAYCGKSAPHGQSRAAPRLFRCAPTISLACCKFRAIGFSQTICFRRRRLLSTIFIMPMGGRATRPSTASISSSSAS